MRRTITSIATLLLVGASGCGTSSTTANSTATTTSAASTATAAESTTAAPATAAAATSTTNVATTSASVTAPAGSVAPTSTEDPRPVDTVAQTLAQAALLQATDFAAPWVQFSPGGDYPTDQQSCSWRPGGAFTLINRGGAQYGPTMQYGTSDAFVSSHSLVMPDAATAAQYVALVNSDEWMKCTIAQLQKYQIDNGSDSTVSVATRDIATLHQNGFESYAEIHFTDTSGNVARTALMSFYVIDRTVIEVSEEYGAIPNADTRTLLDNSYNALVAAYTRVNAI